MGCWNLRREGGSNGKRRVGGGTILDPVPGPLQAVPVSGAGAAFSDSGVATSESESESGSGCGVYVGAEIKTSARASFISLVLAVSAEVGDPGFGWPVTGWRDFRVSILPALTLRFGGIMGAWWWVRWLCGVGLCDGTDRRCAASH